MGFMDTFDVIVGISALEMTMVDLSIPVEPGQGVRVAQRILGDRK